MDKTETFLLCGDQSFDPQYDRTKRVLNVQFSKKNL
jgi:hypothetical protein